jgi:hypothetical protein
MDVIGEPEPRRSSRRARWLGGAAAAGVGVILGAAGIAAAADPTPTPSPSAGSQVAPPGTPPVGGPGLHRGLRRGPGGPGRGLGMRGAVHGEFVVPDGAGWRTVALQRGVVTAVSSTSLTVKSKDGYIRTYVLTAKTLVNAGRDGISTVKNGEEVGVAATVKGGTATADDVRDLTQIRAQRKSFGPPPGSGPNAPEGTPASPSSYNGDGSGQPA